MSARNNQPKPKNGANGGTNHNKYAKRWRAICCWLWGSVSKPDNFPHYLIALFTLGLAIFAYSAWIESRRGTAALEGQLKAMQTDQRPYIWVTNTLPIINFRATTGTNTRQVTIDWQFTNYGRGVAYHFRLAHFIKIGANSQYIVSYGANEQNPWNAEGVMPPGKINFNTVISRPGITQDDLSKRAKSTSQLAF